MPRLFPCTILVLSSCITVGISQCSTDMDGDGWTTPDGDCNDNDPMVHPGADEICDLRDNDCDGSVDEDATDSDSDGIVNCADDVLYTSAFDACDTSWYVVDLGGSTSPSWTCTNGTLYEQSNQGNSLYLLGDFGEQPWFTLSVTIDSNGLGNNNSGFVFNYLDSANYWLAYWSDPDDYYGTGYDSTLYISQIVDGAAVFSAFVDGDPAISSEPTRISLSVDEGNVSMSFDGTEDFVAVRVDASQLPIYPRFVGFYGWDNDGGVIYDDFSMTTP